MALSQDGARLATGSGNTIKIWNVQSETVLQSWSVPGDQINELSLNPSSSMLAVSTWHTALNVWNVRTGEKLFERKCVPSSVQFSPDGTILACGLLDRLELLDTKTWETIQTIPSVANSPALDIAFSKDGEIMVIGKDPANTKSEIELFDVQLPGRASGSSRAQPPTSERTSTETALYFSHLEDEVLIPTLKDDTDALTIEVWLQRDSTHLEAHSQILGSEAYASIYSNAYSALDFQMPDTGGEDGPRKGQHDLVGVGQPVHIAGVRDPANGELRLYYDGKLIQTSKGQIKRGKGTFQICSYEYQWKGGTGNSSFSGWIDEVRISKSVRYQSDFTPQRRFEQDDQTTALYHFDAGNGDTLKDSSGNGHDGKIIGAKWVKADDQPKISHAELSKLFELEFSQNAYVEVPTLKLNREGPITIEAFVTWEGSPSESLLVGVDGGFSLRVHSKDHAFVRWDADAKHLAMLKVLQLGERHHFTGVYTGEKILVFVDGKLVNTINNSSVRMSDASFKMGENFIGKLGPVRVSSVARYETDFTPAQRMQPDKDTLALYHFDQGTGDTLKDSSGNGYDGKIVGAKWVKQEAGQSLPNEPKLEFPGGLEFDGDDVVNIDSLEFDPTKPFTLEAAFSWEYKQGVTNQAVFAGRDVNPRASNAGIKFAPFSYNHTGLRIGEVSIDAGKIPEKHERVHLALVHTGQELLAFRDGKLVGRKPTTGKNLGPGTGRFLIGKSMIGRYEMLRFSTKARYEKDFDPKTRFATDKDTLALYHFDEGTGDILKDSSGNGHDGKIIGAKWVPVGGVTKVSDRSVTESDSKKRKFESGEWIDVIPLIDPEQDRWAVPGLTGANGWRIEKDELFVKIEDGKPCKLVFPVDIESKSIEWDVEFTRTNGKQGFNLDIPHTKGPCPVMFDYVYPGQAAITAVPPLTGACTFQTSQRSTIRLLVRHSDGADEIEAWFNKKSLGTWSGKRSEIGRVAEEGYPIGRRSGLWVPGGDFVFHRIRLKMLNGGTATALRATP
ncbi:LamG-like jellyroll fold domain-containing protein [Thalassoglobus sp.]|uniref:LamG-like jellyroll fold domain-containing protein n=1 Tax=Thalassoglobus sp. TaxID=2795869 RepID=UPI003AA8919A